MHTDEEVEHCYEEFYEDVHTEFLKYGEIVNFKITCEFVGVTRWKVAICGEYMKSRLKTCSRGTACNFIHCFRNPGGDYEWADWDNPPPKYWIEKMVALFGRSDVSEYDKNMETRSGRKLENNKKITSKFSRYPSRRSRSSVVDCLTSSSGGEHSDENRNHQHSHSSRHKCSSSSRKKRSLLDEQQKYEENSSSDEDDRYRYNEKDVAFSHTDRDRISSSSIATSSRWRKRMDYVDGHENLKERHRSSKFRLYSHDSSRKYSSRREHSSGQIQEGSYEHMKQDENYLADSHGRYDPNSGHNSDIAECDNLETNNCFSEHEKYRSTSPDDHKPHGGKFKSQQEISDVNYNKKRSRHSKQNDHRKHSNSREEKADTSDKDQSCEEKHQSSSVNIASHDQSQERKNVLNKVRTSSKTIKGGLNLEKTGEHMKNMVESPEDIQRSRRHGRSSRRERHHRDKAINRDDKTSISGVNDLEQRGSRKRSRSRSPIQSSSR